MKRYCFSLYVNDAQLAAAVFSLLIDKRVSDLKTWTEDDNNHHQTHKAPIVRNRVKDANGKTMLGRDVLLQILKQSGKPMSLQELAKAFSGLGFHINSTGPRISELFKIGLIRQHAKGQYVAV